METLLLFLYIFTVLGRCVTQPHTKFTKEVTCERHLHESSNFCILKNVRLDRQNSRFTISGSVSKITDIEIHSTSNFAVLTSIFCERFPRLEILTIETFRDNLQEIDEDALVKCKKLKKVTIRPNNIRVLKEKTFNRNINLTEIAIEGNNIQTINAETFSNLTNLQWLFLNGNQILEISPGAFKNLIKLKWLDVSCNLLLDLDIEGILKKSKNLEKINIRDNYISCKRLRTVSDILQSSGIIIDKEITTSYLRYRVYKPNYINGVECLSDDRYERELESREQNK